MGFIADFILLLARVCIGVAFLWSAVDKISNYRAAVSYMMSKRIPKVSLVLPIAIVVQMLGGISILLGFQAHIGALLLIIYTIPTAYFMHDFWRMSGDSRAIEKMIFLKDVATLGGLLVILALGVGTFALI